MVLSERRAHRSFVMSPQRKRLLLFTSKLGYQTRSFDDAAAQLGVELIFITAGSHKRKDPGGDRAIAVHFESPEAAAKVVLESQRDLRVDGILALGDRPAVAASYVARGLGIHYNHPAAVEACRSKLRMREIFRDVNLPTPWFRSVPIHPPPEPALLGVSYPCVLKPLSLSASQGVVRANNRDEFAGAAGCLPRFAQIPENRATREGQPGQNARERILSSKELAVEGLLTDGSLRILAIFDKPDPLEGPYFEETIYVTPSRLPESTQHAIEKCARDAVRALGLSHGPIHAEFRINDNGVWALEVAPRPIGGLCAPSLRFSFYAAAEPIGPQELSVRQPPALPREKSPR